MYYTDMMGFFEAELVSLWRARVRHLRPYYSSWKPKQTAKAVTSCDVWYLPVVMMSWFTALSLLILFSLYLDGTLDLCEWNDGMAKPTISVTHLRGQNWDFGKKEGAKKN